MDRIIRAIQELLQTATQDRTSPLYKIGKVIYGDPVKIPESSLPVLTISPVQSDYQARGNMLDQKTHRLEIRLIYNARSFYEKDTTTGQIDKVHAVEDAVKKMERSDSGLKTATTSVAGVIESNPGLPLTENGQSVNTASLAKVTGISYPGLKNERGFHTYESVLVMEAIAVGDRH